MKKIEINLYPAVKKGKIQIFDLMESYLTPAVLAVCGLILLNLLLAAFLGLSSFSQARANSRWKAISVQAGELAGLKSEISALRTEKQHYSDLLGSGPELSRICAELYAALPRNMWLEEIKFKKDVFSFKGYTVRWKEDPLATLSSFISGLKKQQYFSSLFSQVSTKKSRRAEYMGQEVTEFEVECKN